MFAHAQSTGSGNHMQILTACPLCQANYNPLKTQIMAERDDAHLLYLECRQCGSSVVAVVTTGVGGLSSVGTVTDLTSHEIVAFQDKADVSSDDVLDLYAWLEDSDRNFLALQAGRAA